MKAFSALLKKEFLDARRSGRLLIIVVIFVLFGIMNPVIAKLTPWMLTKMMADYGLAFTEIRVDAMTSWTQFFKNIPIALIVFILMFSGIFTREYKSGTLLLVLAKGLSRYKVVLAKMLLLLLLWTFGYGLCFGITYVYNAYYWDNSIVPNLFSAAAVWWLFGVWVICLLVLFSVLLQDNTGVTLCTGGAVLLAYLFCMIPGIKPYSPAILMDSGSLLNGIMEIDSYIKAIIINMSFNVIGIAVSIPVMNRRQI